MVQLLHDGESTSFPATLGDLVRLSDSLKLITDRKPSSFIFVLCYDIINYGRAPFAKPHDHIFFSVQKTQTAIAI